MLDHICITSAVSTCQMGLFMVVASIICMYVNVTAEPKVVFETLILEDTDRAQITI